MFRILFYHNVFVFGLKKLANFCKQFSDFEILKITRPLNLNLDESVFKEKKNL